MTGLNYVFVERVSLFFAFFDMLEMLGGRSGIGLFNGK